VKPCPVCSRPGARPLYEGIVQCPHCTHAWADLNPTDKQLEKIYEKKYFFGEEYVDYLRDRAVLERNFRSRLGVLDRFLDPSRHQNLLEIGSAYGFFLAMVQSRFKKVLGFEISRDGAAYARRSGLPVLRKDFLKHHLQGYPVDVACLWDTVEHLRDPRKFLAKLSRSMKPGALVTLTTGDLSSWNARFRGEKWRLIHPPTHLHYFTRESLRTMFELNGFEVIYMKHCGFWRSLDNAAYISLVLRSNRKKWYDLFRRSFLSRGQLYLNMFDILHVIARRR